MNQASLTALCASLGPHLLSALQIPSFELIRELLVDDLSCILVFFVAITSVRHVFALAALTCKEPFLILHMDKDGLIPKTILLSKRWLSVLHHNEGIILYSLCPAPKHPNKIALHCLDVIRANLKTTTPIGKTDSLSIISSGPSKKHTASKSIAIAYNLKDTAPTALLHAYATRSVGVSRAFRHYPLSSSFVRPPPVLLSIRFQSSTRWTNLLQIQLSAAKF